MRLVLIARISAWCVLLSGPVFYSSPTLAQTTVDQADSHRIQKGDSYWKIAKENTGRASNWKAIAKANRQSPATRLSVGTQISIPAALVAAQKTAAQIEDSKGQVEITPALANNQNLLREGSKITTGDRGNVVLSLPDKTQLIIEPSTTVIFERMRRYHSNETVDARIRLEQGRVQATSPEKRRYPLEIKTQRGTAAVRGTRFRVSANGLSNTTEVLSGSVLYTTPKTATMVNNGEGLVLNENSQIPFIEKLLHEPEITLAPSYGQLKNSLTWNPVPGAVDYRVAVSRDSKGADLVQPIQQSQSPFEFTSAAEGDFYLHVQAVSPNGIVGRRNSQKFSLTQNALPAPPTFVKLVRAQRSRAAEDLVGENFVETRVEWQPEAGVSTQVQVAMDPEFKEIIIDEEVTEHRFVVPNKLRGKTVYLRMATLEWAGAQQRRGRFGPTLELTW